MKNDYPNSHADAHGSIKSYIAGFGLSVLLTAASFGVVMADVVPHHSRMSVIVVLCLVQLLVQLVYFLHMGSSPSQRVNTGVFACTAFLIAVLVGGSLWVMHNSDVNMMPTEMSQQDARNHE
jgi:cytochrome o ubiquinol oxidase operon protein cyoD